MIEYFLESVRLGSFSKAARSLGVTPASVSRQVQLLEQRLGARLFNRTTRHLSLTEAGVLFAERARRFVDDLTETEDWVRQLSNSPSGVLRLTAPASFGRLHIAPWLPDFLAQYPQIKLDIVFTDRTIDLIEDKIDVAIRISDAPDSSIVWRKLARQKSVVCASPAYVEQHGRPGSFAGLQEHNCLIYGSRFTARWRFYDGTREVDHADVSGNMAARDGDTTFIATLRGLGISLQPSWRVGKELRQGSLIDLFPGFWASSIGAASSIHAFYQHREYLAPKVKVFVDYLISVYGTPPYWE